MITLSPKGYWVNRETTVSFKNNIDNKWYYFNAKLNLEEYMRDKGFDYFEWDFLSTQKLGDYKTLWIIKINSSDDKADYTFLLKVVEKSKCIDPGEKVFQIDYFKVIEFDVIDKEYHPANLNEFLN